MYIGSTIELKQVQLEYTLSANTTQDEAKMLYIKNTQYSAFDKQEENHKVQAKNASKVNCKHYPCITIISNNMLIHFCSEDIQDGSIKTAPLHCCNNADSNPRSEKSLHLFIQESYREYCIICTFRKHQIFTT